MYELKLAYNLYIVYICFIIVNKVIQNNMIAQEKYCEIILNNPELLGELVKRTGKQYKLQTLEIALKRKSPSIRRNIGLIETLRNSGLMDEQIFETEKA